MLYDPSFGCTGGSCYRGCDNGSQPLFLGLGRCCGSGILCLGSSSTTGVGASDTERLSYPVQLEQYLQGRLGFPVEVINHGNSGAFFYQLALMLDGLLARLNPDLVIIYFGNNMDQRGLREHYNKMFKIVREAPYIETDLELWVAMRLKYPSEAAIKAFLFLCRSSLFRLAIKLVRYVQDDLLSPQIKYMAAGGLYIDPRTPHDITETCKRRGVKLLLIPELVRTAVEKRQAYLDGKADQIPKVFQYTGIFRDLAAKNRGKGIYYANLMGQFTPEKARTMLMDNCHMNDQGYSWLARQIASVVQDLDLSPRRRSGEGR